MGVHQHLVGVMLLGLIVQGIVSIAGNSDQDSSIKVKHERSHVFLSCELGGNPVLRWVKDGQNISSSNKSELFVGLAADDPKGLYWCFSANKNASLQLHFRMCQYCVQLNYAVMMGVVAADIIATALLVVAVWCLASQEPGWLSRASDKQALLTHDQLYQPLGERNNGQYSHIGGAKARHR